MTPTTGNSLGVHVATTAIAAAAVLLGTFGAIASHDRHSDRPALGTTRTARLSNTRHDDEAATPHIGRRGLSCLASAIWYEAENQPEEGRIAVAEVVMGRTRSNRFPKGVCAVVAQKHQFSFVHGDGIVPSVPTNHVDEMIAIARGVVEGKLRSRFHNALHFHATYVSPDWDLPRIGQVGAHVFYGGQS